MLIELVEATRDEFSGFTLKGTFVNPEEVRSVDPYESPILRNAMRLKQLAESTKFSKLTLVGNETKIIIGDYRDVSRRIDPHARPLKDGFDTGKGDNKILLNE